MNRLLPLMLLTLPLLAGPADYELYPSGSSVATNTKLLVRFPCCGERNQNPVTLRTGNETVPGRTDYLDFEWLVFTPSQALKPNTDYTVSVNISWRPSFTASFRTASGPDNTAPVLLSSSPAAGGDTGGLFEAPVLLRFSKPVNPLPFATTAKAIVRNLGSTSESYVSGVALSDATTIRLNVALSPGSVYRLYFPDGTPEDLAGNRVDPPGPDFVFTTYPEAPKDGAKVRASIPAEGDSAVPTNAAIFLSFDRPVLKPEDGAFSLGSDGDPSVSMSVELIEARNALILRPKTLLRGNQTYALRINRLYDAYGGLVASGQVILFTTALLPELKPFAQVSGPNGTMPRVAKLQWRYSRPLNPWLLPRVAALTGAGFTPPELVTRLLDDGLTLEADIPGPGEYVLAGYPYDRIESKPLSSYGSSFLITPMRDDRPPAVLTTQPPDQSTGVPPEVTPTILFDESTSGADPDGLTLWKGSERVLATVAVDSNRLRYVLTPKTPLEDGIEYRAEFRQPYDMSGNVGGDVSWTFRVEAARPADAFSLVSVEPANNAADVPVTSNIILTFSRAPNPISIAGGCSLVAVGRDSIPGTWEVTGNRAVFRPQFRLPGSSRISVILCSPTDLRNESLTRPFIPVFSTAPDPEPPQPLRVGFISPAVGEFAVSGDAAVVLELSQPVAASTLGREPVSVTGPDGRNVARGATYNERTRRLTISTEVTANGTFTVTPSAAIRSLSGAMAEPFTANVELRSRTLSYSTSLQPSSPGMLRSAEARWSGRSLILIVYFASPIDPSVLDAALRVVSGSSALNIRAAEWTPDHRAVVLHLSGRFDDAPPRTFVILSLAPWSRSGVEFVSVSIGTPPTPGLVEWNVIGPFGTIPSDAVIEVEFPGARPADYIRSAMIWTGNHVPLMTLEPVQRTDRRFRLRMPQALAPGTAAGIELETQTGDKVSTFLRTSTFGTPESRQIIVGPTLEMGEVPVNAVVWLQSKTILNPLSIRPQITVDGEVMPFTAEFLDSGFLVLLRPLGLLRGNAAYQVSLQGLEDQAGRPLPDRTWAFRTGSGPDYKPTEVDSWYPSGTTSTDVVPRVTFTNPVIFVRNNAWDSSLNTVSDFTIASPSGGIAGSIDVSPDGRTLSYKPDKPWPPNSTIDLPVNRFTIFDWTAAPLGDTVRGVPRPPSFSTSATP